MDDSLHSALTWTELALAGLTALVLLFVRAPYGRHDRGGWGPRMPNWLGWVLMEFPALLVFVGVYAQGQHRASWVPLLMLGLWMSHYLHRSLIYPWSLSSRSKPIPFLVVLLGAAFNTLNAYINARWVAHLGSYTDTWLLDPRFGLGVAIFLTGAWINRTADRMLRLLRKPGETGYTIPRGWLYEYVSCPNYLGELVEWSGWALLTWSLPGLAFFTYTAANLVPRALSHHRWYREQFSDYPRQRKAIVPLLL